MFESSPAHHQPPNPVESGLMAGFFANRPAQAEVDQASPGTGPRSSESRDYVGLEKAVRAVPERRSGTDLHRNPSWVSKRYSAVM